MSNLEFMVAAARVIATSIGAVVFLMWLAGCLGLADFRIIFVVPEVLA